MYKDLKDFEKVLELNKMDKTEEEADFIYNKSHIFMFDEIGFVESFEDFNTLELYDAGCDLSLETLCIQEVAGLAKSLMTWLKIRGFEVEKLCL